MSANQPPDPYFSNINFNPNFFKIISTYLTETIANSKYLRLIGGILSGNLGIKRTPRVELDVVGKAIINTNLYAPPNIGILGGTGAKLILTEGTVSAAPYALGTDFQTLWYGTPADGNHIFYTNTNERMRITNSGAVAIGTNTPTSGNTRLTISGASFGFSQPLVDIIQTGDWDGNYALQVTGYANLGGFRINGADIYGNVTQTLANKDISFQTLNTNTTGGDIKFTTFGAGGDIIFITNGNNQRILINAAGNVGIGATTAINNILQVGDGARLRISNGPTDYTLIGSKDGDDINNTRIVIHGYQRSGGFDGDINYYATTTGGTHQFFINNVLLGVISAAGLTINKNISLTSGAYRNGGFSVAHTTKIRNGSGASTPGYFIDPYDYANSLMICAFSLDSTSYQVWNGRISINKFAAVTDVTNFYAPNSMVVDNFIESGTFRSWIYINPNTAYNTATNLLAKIYG